MSHQIPDPCPECQPFGGNWCEDPKGGLKRCGCPRGRFLAAPKPKAEYREPAISSEAALTITRMMSAMSFYPAAPEGETMIAMELASIVNSPEEAYRLVREMVRRYQKFPGAIELRAVYTAVIGTPRDGLEAISPHVEQLREAEEQAKQLAAPAGPKLLPGQVTAAESVQATITELKAKTSMSRYLAGHDAPRVPEIPVRNMATTKPITQADIDAAVATNRDRRAREELGFGPDVADAVDQRWAREEVERLKASKDPAA